MWDHLKSDLYYGHTWAKGKGESCDGCTLTPSYLTEAYTHWHPLNLTCWEHAQSYVSSLEACTYRCQTPCPYPISIHTTQVVTFLTKFAIVSYFLWVQNCLFSPLQVKNNTWQDCKMCPYSWTRHGHESNNMITRTIIHTTSFLIVFSAQYLHTNLLLMRQRYQWILLAEAGTCIFIF